MSKVILPTDQMHRYNPPPSAPPSDLPSPFPEADPPSPLTEAETETEEILDDEIPRYPQIYLDNIYMYNIAILVLAVIYTLGYVGQLVGQGILARLIYHSYPRPDLKPGLFVDDRINYFAIILAIAATRLPVIFTSIWMLRPVTKSLKRTMNLVVCIFYLIVDILVLISLGIAWGLICNKPGFGYAPCNAFPQDQCSVYGSSLPDRCMPPYPVPPSSPLEPTWAFYLVFGCIGGMTLLEIALLIFNVFLDEEAREYKQHLVFYQTY